MDAAPFIAEHRFGYGPKGGNIFSGDAVGWVLSQLQRPAAGLNAFATLKSGMELLPELKKIKSEIKEMKSAADSAKADMAASPSDMQDDKDALKALQKEYAAYYLAEVDARFTLMATTDTPFLERLAWFWSNHFAVSGEKGEVVPLAGAYEREALRPHITGYFGDLLKAALQHPAMIIYLDNEKSINPALGELKRELREKRGKPPGTGPSGINENLAREAMELHTLGVNGGYTQADVTRFAHVLTGWNVRANENIIKHMDSSSDNGTGFGFSNLLHDPSPQTIMGKTYAQPGMAQGEAVLDDLAHHPATARHIATKLAQHFIADAPPPALVERLARVFYQSGGHLPTVYEALVKSNEAWQQPLGKSKNAIEYLASTLRLFPAVHSDPKMIVGMLNQMGQKPWFPPSPQGWPDTAAQWITPDRLWKRMEWAQTVSARAGAHVDARALSEAAYGPLLSDTTRTGIAQAESGKQALALLLLSPEFQRR